MATSVVKLATVLLISMVITAPQAEAAISCATVITSMSSCIGYVQRGGAPPPACCDGVKSVYGAATSTPDRQAVCSCVKTFLPRVGADPGLVNNLKGKCGVIISYTYTPSIDCSKIK